MNTVAIIFSWIWNIFQVILAFALMIFFALPDMIDKNGTEVIWLFGNAVPVDGEVFAIGVFRFALWTIAGAIAILYVLVGFLQAAYLPLDDKWTRGANWMASLVVAFPLAWTWWHLFSDGGSNITLFQEQILYLGTIAVVLDILMDSILPWIKRAGARIQARPAPAAAP